MSAIVVYESHWGNTGAVARAIAEGLERAGYRRVAEPAGFVVKGRYGPLRDGELDAARAWGARLAALQA